VQSTSDKIKIKRKIGINQSGYKRGNKQGRKKQRGINKRGIMQGKKTKVK
jgi:hypothetical protein